MEASFVSRHEESSLVAAESGCDVSGRRDTSSSPLSNLIESLRTILSDPIKKLAALVGWKAVGTTQCLNGWYVLVKTLDNAESVKLRYGPLAKATEDPSAKATPSKMISNWL
ncbi:unnamed protein product [Brassica rapa]|uniref:PUB 62/63 C-terminal domain-containing protein n=3 Tax=Brassica TaxID=3705 RepID=A0A3P5Y4I9_BRACM|nr:unnamed protein product [Brassica napus]CAG7865179.1 unnamed protein product [Brassica rapa]CDY29546.1 BnaA03g53910D [Brassica napus]VDC62279.1 unnamed protein product [Brassica rapa]